MQKFAYTVEKKYEGLSIREVLKEEFKISRRMLKRLRWEGQTYLNAEEAMLWYPVKQGDQILALADLHVTPPDLHFPPDQQPVFQNSDLLVMSKKAGQVVHKSLNSDLVDLCGLISDQPLHPVQRLDRDTTGLVIIALNAYTHYRLSQSELIKKYVGICHGEFPAPSGLIDAPIGRAQNSIMEREVSPQGKAARTGYRVLAYDSASDLSFVEFRLFTGRTHQIRVHTRYWGHPLLGDSMYGLDQAQDRDMGRQALHAYHLEFPLPYTEDRVILDDPVPPDMQAVCDRCHFLMP
ncbi:MAG: RluA family pseudouridine synthase [Eubacteriales bacterium]|nr:RluA family pseudouridine synthase [Eubacteriales bacterium]